MPLRSEGFYRSKDSDPQEQDRARKGAFSQAFANRPKMFGPALPAPSASPLDNDEDDAAAYMNAIHQALGSHPDLGMGMRPIFGGQIEGGGLSSADHAAMGGKKAPARTSVSKALMQAIQAPSIEAGISGVDMPGSEIPVDPGIAPLQSSGSVGLAANPTAPGGLPAQKKGHGVSALLKAILGGIKR